MRFALFQLPCYRPGFGPSQGAFYADMVAQARFADEAGWSRLYVSEHHFHYYGGAVPNPPVDLANPPMEFPPGREKIYAMTDEEVQSRLSETTPPVPPKR